MLATLIGIDRLRKRDVRRFVVCDDRPRALDRNRGFDRGQLFVFRVRRRRPAVVERLARIATEAVVQIEACFASLLRTRWCCRHRNRYATSFASIVIVALSAREIWQFALASAAISANFAASILPT